MKILIIGGFGYGNLGDEAILSTLIEKLKKKGIRDIKLLSKNPIESKVIHQCEALPSFDKLSVFPSFPGHPLKLPFNIIQTFIMICIQKLKIFNKEIYRILNNIKEADYIISCGGGFFNDRWWSFYPILFEHFLCTILNKKLIITSQSIGPFKNKFLTLIIKYIFNSALYISVRDKTSFIHLHKIGIDTKNVYLAADEAIDFDTIDTKSTIQSLIRHRKKFPNRLLFGLTLQTHRAYISKEGTLCNGSQEDYFNSIARALNTINTITPVELLIIPSTGFKHDLTYAYQLCMKLRVNNLIANVKKVIHPYDLLNIISLVDIYISSNFHPIIFSAIQRIPFIAISYSTKIDDFVYSLKLEKYLLRIDMMQEKDLIEKIQLILLSKNDLLSKLDECIPELKLKIENNFHNICNIMK